MSSLYLDLGNTQAKWLLSSGQTGALSYNGFGTQLELILSDQSSACDVVVASVLGPQGTENILSALKAVGLKKIRQCVVTPFAAGVRCGYEDVTRLGIDRWLAVLASWQRYGTACLVADLGTAATLDVVDFNGVHQGGFIVSGLSLSVDGLLSGTQNIRPKSEGFEEVSLALGCSTAAAIHNGALASLVALVDVQFQKLLKSNCEAKLVLAGGDASLVGSHLESNFELVHGLVLEGMKVLERAQLLVEVD